MVALVSHPRGNTGTPPPAAATSILERTVWDQRAVTGIRTIALQQQQSAYIREIAVSERRASVARQIVAIGTVVATTSIVVPKQSQVARTSSSSSARLEAPPTPRLRPQQEDVLLVEQWYTSMHSESTGEGQLRLIELNLDQFSFQMLGTSMGREWIYRLLAKLLSTFDAEHNLARMYPSMSHHAAKWNELSIRTNTVARSLGVDFNHKRKRMH